MSEPACERCRFFDGDNHGLCDGTVGLCRRNAPTIHPCSGDPDNEDAVWPWVRADDYCGEFQEKVDADKVS